MALATQCPHCHTTFRVAHDQLKLRAGLVRCGSCKQIFNGIENLLRPEEPASEPASTDATASKPQLPSQPPDSPVQHEPQATPVPQPESTTQAATSEPVEPVVPVAPVEAKPVPDIESIPPASPPTGSETIRLAAEDPNLDPMLRMTLLDVDLGKHATAEIARAAAPAPEASDALEQTIDNLQNKPWRKEPEPSVEAEGDALDQVEAAEYEEPAFVRQARRRQRLGRVLRVLMILGSAVLLTTLLAQCAYVFRDQIAARFPQARPALVQACAYMDCQVGLPTQIDLVSIESNELQTLSANDNTFVLTVLLRNQGATAQAWPHIELTLNDVNENAIVRRVFAPRDYLPAGQDFSQGFAPASEQPIKLFFELSQLKASGYRVYLFYP